MVVSMQSNRRLPHQIGERASITCGSRCETSIVFAGVLIIRAVASAVSADFSAYPRKKTVR